MGMLKTEKKKVDDHAAFYQSLLPPDHPDRQGPTNSATLQKETDCRDIIPTPNDILLGRGAFMNNYTGNQHLRSLARERKSQFDIGCPTDRRKLGVEIARLIKGNQGRLLKRASYALQEPVLLHDGKYKLPPRELEGPWEEVTEDKACEKAMQVLRDMKAQKS